MQVYRQSHQYQLIISWPLGQVCPYWLYSFKNIIFLYTVLYIYISFIILKSVFIDNYSVWLQMKKMKNYVTAINQRPRFVFDFAKTQKVGFLFSRKLHPYSSVYFRFGKYSYLLHFQPCNTEFYTWKKRDIFTGCYFHTVKISKVLFPVWK